ncbi:MAG: DUF1549 domain-containing protein [Verrucomicrobiae bacterium]|nr:DUF1549 domain-containing protein [Verrucomicrobiae bacterium]
MAFLSDQFCSSRVTDLSRRALVWLVVSAAITLLPTSGLAEDGIAFFENKVRPILVTQCYECHSEEAGKQKGGLLLDRREGWQTGGDSGPALIPGDVDQSLFAHSIRYLDEDLQMPPKNRLATEEIEILERWIAMGAPDPRDEALTGNVRKEPIDFAKARQNWAFRPHTRPTIPKVEDAADANWGRDEIDDFILAELKSRNLSPVPDATPGPLLRRLFYDLTGLPPTPEEVAAFEKDPSPKALAAVVDDLLNRPAFGEKWGRHWLDVARYADSNGGDRNYTFFQAWRYRNYVIDSFNRDRSFYDFVQQQLAGDLMLAESDEQRHDQLVASTFLAMGPKMLTERDKEKLRLDTADEQVDTVGRAFLGLTMGCARCHDHKFDPISQEDYYAMAGIFRSTQVVMGTRNGCVNVASWVEQPLPIAEPKRSELTAKVDQLELAMRLIVEKSFMKKAGGKMSLDMLPLAGVIIDDSDAELVGEWKSSSLSPNRFGPGYVHDDQKNKGERRIIFRSSLPESGIYEVRVAYSSDSNRSRAVPITVEARDGIHQVTLDQTQRPKIGGLFQTIGRFSFEKGGRVNVVIENSGTEGFVIADAVQFIAVADIEREAKALASMEDDDGQMLFRMSEGDLKKRLDVMLKELREAELAMAPRDADDAGDINLRVRGEVNQLGPIVPRNFPKALHDGSPPELAEGTSGRLELAQWITNPENALLDRVMVNRIWHHLFGRGIVASVDNFGVLGDKPTHPQLLEYLASDFRDSGGSIKSLVRRLVLSRSYQLSADASPALAEADPTNSLFGHQNRRRLEAEEVRDSVLFLSGKLDSVPGQATAIRYGSDDLDAPMNFEKDTLRTVYLPVARNNLVADLEIFDAANPDLVSGNRPTTTVPTQALYLMNSDFFLTQAKEIGSHALAAAETPEAEIAWLYRKILSRPPTAEESDNALAFIREISSGAKTEAERSEAFGHLAHLLLVSTEFLFLD